MHKLPQPVKLWYLGPFFRHERAQAGRYRQFWQIGAEAIGSDDPAVDAELILLLAELLEELGVRGLRLRLSSLGTPETRAAYREQLQTLPARARGPSCPRTCARASTLNPLRAFDADHPGTRDVMADAPLLLDHLDAEDAEHFAQVRALLDAVGCRTRSTRRSCAASTTTRARSSSSRSDALGAQSGVGGGGRYDGLAEQLGGAADARHGLGGRRRADAARRRGAPRSRRGLRSLRRLAGDLDGAGPRRSRSPPRHAAPGSRRQVELAGRSLKGQLKQAARLRPATLRSSATRGSR